MEKIPYYSLNQYLHDTLGQKVYKIAIDGGFTCPNRDGRVDTRGCIFCSEGGSGEFAGNRNETVTEQINKGKALVDAKLPGDSGHKYIAYFQCFTNTYAPVDILRDKYMEAVSHPDIAIVSIASRPDCLSPEVINLLDEINKIKPLWVELGLQTIHGETAAFIRRGYPLSVYDKALSDLKSIGVHVITHVIFGLPSETREMMLDTVKYVVKSGSSGIKLQLLHVLKNTDLAALYEQCAFDTLSEEDYVNLIVDAVKLLPPDMVVHRLTGDGDKKLLIAPMWSANKKHVLNTINKYLIPTSPLRNT